MKRVFIFIAIASALLMGQTLQVKNVYPVQTMYKADFAFPRFSPDGAQLLFTQSNFRGLWLHDLNSGSTRQINDHSGAGFEPCFSPDGREVYFRIDEWVRGRRFSSLAVQALDSQEATLLINRQRLLSPPRHVGAAQLAYTLGNTLQQQVLPATLTKKAPGDAAPEIFAYVEPSNDVIVISIDGRKQSLRPLAETGDERYLHASVGPDGEKLLFQIGGRGSYITDLGGNLLTELGVARAPQWSPDGKWVVCMVDEDDGHRYTASEIWVVSSDGENRYQLTDSDTKIEMYPVWSPAMDRIAYHTISGHIEIMEIEINE